jgi:hypothetical protein
MAQNVHNWILKVSSFQNPSFSETLFPQQSFSMFLRPFLGGFASFGCRFKL